VPGPARRAGTTFAFIRYLFPGWLRHMKAIRSIAAITD
jgi:hypothetical protein